MQKYLISFASLAIVIGGFLAVKKLKKSRSSIEQRKLIDLVGNTPLIYL